MFDRLSEGLSQVFGRIRGDRPDDRRAFLEAVRDQLLEADTHPEVAAELLERLEARLERPETDHSLTPSQRFLKSFEESVRHILGERPEPLRLPSGGTAAILVVGLQGTGKTTTVGKLARHLRDQGRSVLLVPLDVRRPAAIEQLKVLGERVGVPVWATKPGAKPLKEARAALKHAQRQGFDVAIFDTAGRLAIDTELMAEIGELRERLRPQEILYVLDAMAGQSAVATAERFAATVRPTGIVVTKVDADPRGGAVLSVRARTGIPVKLMGVGEDLAALEPFDPERIVRRLLDLGDLEELAARFDRAVDAAEAEALTERFMRGTFNLEDFAKQLEMMSKLGSLEGILKMLPGGKGMVRQIKDLSLAERDMRRTLAIIRSMTPLERRNPRLLNQSRKQRIARGSGTSVAEVNKLLKRYQTMQKLFKRLRRMPIGAMQQLLGGGGRGGLPPGLLGR